MNSSFVLKGKLNLELLTVFSLVYPEEGSIAETSVKILIITASVLQFLNLQNLTRTSLSYKCEVKDKEPKVWKKTKQFFTLLLSLLTRNMFHTQIPLSHWLKSTVFSLNDVHFCKKHASYLSSRSPFSLFVSSYETLRILVHKYVTREANTITTHTTYFSDTITSLWTCLMYLIRMMLVSKQIVSWRTWLDVLFIFILQ